MYTKTFDGMGVSHFGVVHCKLKDTFLVQAAVWLRPHFAPNDDYNIMDVFLQAISHTSVIDALNALLKEVEFRLPRSKD